MCSTGCRHTLSVSHSAGPSRQRTPCVRHVIFIARGPFHQPPDGLCCFPSGRINGTRRTRDFGRNSIAEFMRCHRLGHHAAGGVKISSFSRSFALSSSERFIQRVTAAPITGLFCPPYSAGDATFACPLTDHRSSFLFVRFARLGLHSPALTAPKPRICRGEFGQKRDIASCGASSAGANTSFMSCFILGDQGPFPSGVLRCGQKGINRRAAQKTSCATAA